MLVAEEAPYLWKDFREAEVPVVRSHAVKTATNGEICDPEYGDRLIQQVCIEGAQLTTQERRALVEVLETHATAFSWHKASPIVLVKKKDGLLQFGVDYWRLSDLTTRDANPLFWIEDSLAALGRA